MTDERSEDVDEIENMLAQQLYDEVQFDELQSQLAANAATIAAQAAEIERWKRRCSRWLKNSTK